MLERIKDLKMLVLVWMIQTTALLVLALAGLLPPSFVLVAAAHDSNLFLRAAASASTNNNATTTPVTPSRDDIVHDSVATTYIVGGDVLTTPAQRIPFYATVEGAPILCGASLIWPDALLSAAHCADAFTVPGRRVHIGGITWNPWSDAQQTLTIRKSIKHPLYGAARTGGFDYDIMLIFTRELAPNTTPLAVVNTDPLQPRVGQDVYMVGFGSTNDHTVIPSYNIVLSHTLKASYETVVNDTACITSQTADFQLKANHSLCTKAKTGISCSGDSGGPLLPSPNSSTILGLSSFGAKYETVNGTLVKACTKNVAGYTRVSTFAPWILEALCANSKRKPDSCNGGNAPPNRPVAPPIRPPTAQPVPAATPVLPLPPQQPPRLSPIPAPSAGIGVPVLPPRSPATSPLSPLSSPVLKTTASPQLAVIPPSTSTNAPISQQQPSPSPFSPPSAPLQPAVVVPVVASTPPIPIATVAPQSSPTITEPPRSVPILMVPLETPIPSVAKPQPMSVSPATRRPAAAGGPTSPPVSPIAIPDPMTPPRPMPTPMVSQPLPRPVVAPIVDPTVRPAPIAPASVAPMGKVPSLPTTRAPTFVVPVAPSKPTSPSLPTTPCRLGCRIRKWLQSIFDIF